MGRYDDWILAVQGCKNCPMECQGRKVVGAGNVESNLLIVGEAPGAEEIQQGIPFVGKSGKDLRLMFAEVNLKPDEYFLTNVIHCRPWQTGKKGPINRTPTKEEIQSCAPHLRELIDIMKPPVILAVGAIAKSAVGQIKPAAQVFPITHPAALLRWSAGAAEAERLRMIKGIKQARTRARLSVRDGSNGFFVNPAEYIDHEMVRVLEERPEIEDWSITL